MKENLQNLGYFSAYVANTVQNDTNGALTIINGDESESRLELYIDNEFIASGFGFPDKASYTTAITYIGDLGSKMESIAPNLRLLVGSSLGAKLISHAGGLKRLASYPSSTVQIMGAEKALFRHLKSGDRPPKYGLIFQHPQVRGSKWWNRGKIARLLAGRISLAARKDVFTNDFNPEIFNEFNLKVEEIEKNNPFPTKTSKKRKEERQKSKNRRNKGKKRRRK